MSSLYALFYRDSAGILELKIVLYLFLSILQFRFIFGLFF